MKNLSKICKDITKSNKWIGFVDWCNNTYEPFIIMDRTFGIGDIIHQLPYEFQKKAIKRFIQNDESVNVHGWYDCDSSWTLYIFDPSNVEDYVRRDFSKFKELIVYYFNEVI